MNSKIDMSWTLFLDRDGVVNVRLIDEYVRTLDEFVFVDGVPSAIQQLSKLFGRIIVVTNQQGIGKGLMSADDLTVIHDAMHARIKDAGGRIDAVYYCPHHKNDRCNCRKPRIGMALQAKEQFPEIDFARSVMVGDSRSDMEFGEDAGMYCVYVSADRSCYEGCLHPVFLSLADFTNHIVKTGSL